MFLCNDGHEEAWYKTPPCPICEALRKLREIEEVLRKHRSGRLMASHRKAIDALYDLFAGKGD